MPVLKRTQMYFYENILMELKRKAEEENSSVAGIVRNAVSEFLAKESEKDWIKDPLWNIIGSAHSKDKDLSVNHDKYLYGKNK